MSQKKKSFDVLKDKIKKHKKSGLCVIGLILVIILLVFIWAHNCPTNNVFSTIKLPWKFNSRKNKTKDKWPKVPKRPRHGGGVRSDSGPGGIDAGSGNKKEFLKSVANFNKLAAAPSHN
jgi:hypothetical protein